MSSKRVRDASGSLIERAAEAYGFGAAAVSPFKPIAQSFEIGRASCRERVW